ncbi:MAG: glycosyltransferase family 2 protein [Thermoanaerobaculia bacterium]
MGRLVSVVLVTWDSAAYLPRCLEGLAQQSWPDVELIAVDNASSDGSVALVETVARIVIRNGSNRGFSVAVNQGIAAARGEMVLLLNPDCHLHRDYISRLVGSLDEAGPDFGSATGKLLGAHGTSIEPAGTIDSMGIRMTRSGRHFDIGQGERDTSAPGFDGLRELRGATREVFGVSGAAAMFRRTFIEDVSIGGEFLDEDFFAYREDADVAWRGRIFGWRALCEPEAVAWHVRSVTPEKRRALSAAVNMHGVKNRFMLRIKNEGMALAIRNAPFELARDAVVIAATLTVERKSFPAIGWLLRNRRRVLAKRREIQSRRRVGDLDLAGWFQ